MSGLSLFWSSFLKNQSLTLSPPLEVLLLDLLIVAQDGGVQVAVDHLVVLDAHLLCELQ